METKVNYKDYCFQKLFSKFPKMVSNLENYNNQVCLLFCRQYFAIGIHVVIKMETKENYEDFYFQKLFPKVSEKVSM